MLSILPNSILAGSRRLFYESNFPDFKSEYGVSDILIVITLILTIFLALLPMARQKKERKRYLRLVLSRFVANAERINTNKISILYANLLNDLTNGKTEREEPYLLTAYDEIKSLDRNDLYELLKSHSTFRDSGGFNRIHDKLSNIFEYCDKWNIKLELYDLIEKDIFDRIVRDSGKSHDLMDKVYVVVSQNNFENSLINWQNGNALIALIENFFQTNAGIATTFDTIVRDLVVPSLEQIRADLINYPQTLECTQFAHMMVDIEQLHVQQKEFLTTIEKEIKRRRDEPIVKEEIFDKIISELKKINDELQ